MVIYCVPAASMVPCAVERASPPSTRLRFPSSALNRWCSRVGARTKSGTACACHRSPPGRGVGSGVALAAGWLLMFQSDWAVSCLRANSARGRSVVCGSRVRVMSVGAWSYRKRTRTVSYIDYSASLWVSYGTHVQRQRAVPPPRTSTQESED